VQAGFPVVRALHSLEVKTDDRLSRMARSVSAAVQEGGTLTQALAARPGLMDLAQERILECAERSGRLEEGLKELARDLALRRELLRKTRSGLTYPVLLLHAAILIPPIGTLVLVGPRAFLAAVLPTLSSGYALVAAGWMFWRFSRTRPRLAAKVWSLAEGVPLAGSPLLALAVARFLQVLRAAISSGLMPQESLILAARASGNPRWEGVALQGDERLHEAMKRLPRFPPLMIDQVALAEESGRYDDVLDRLAERSREDADRALRTSVAVLKHGGYWLAIGMMVWRIFSMLGGMPVPPMVPE